jgi:hypothetical protein
LRAEELSNDGKTSRRTHNRRTGHKALHLVSAFATDKVLAICRLLASGCSSALSWPPFSPSFVQARIDPELVEGACRPRRLESLGQGP